MKIFLVGWFGSGNLGDEAILRAELLYFRTHVPGVQFSILSFQPERTRRLTADIPEAQKIVKMGTKRSVLTSQFGQLVKTVREVDVVVIGGGGLFQDIYNYYPIPFFSLMTWLAYHYHKQVVWYCLGIGPIRTWFGKTLTRWAATLADVISVRDAESKIWLECASVSKPVCLAADPVLLLPVVSNARVANILKTCAIDDERPTIIVCVHELLKWDQQQETFAAALDRVVQKHQANLVFLPFGLYRNRWFGSHSGDTVDLSASKHVRAYMHEPSHLVTEELTPQEMLTVIGNAAVVISMRFHGLVMALRMGVPVMALTFRQEMKLRFLMARLGLNGQCFDIESLAMENFLSQITQVLAAGSELKERLRASLSSLQAELETCNTHVLNALHEYSEQQQEW